MAVSPELDLSQDVVQLAAAVVDIPSESHHERVIADAVEAAVAHLAHLHVRRVGNSIIARTELGRAERVIIAGHIDTVPAADNLPHRFEDDRLYGLGACDMKGGVSVALRLAATVTEPTDDVTFIWYDCEEVESHHNGIRRINAESPKLLDADFAILMEPSNARIEAGCQGSMRADITAPGKRAHAARAWMGDNAIHKIGEVLTRLSDYEPRIVEIDGLIYREGLNAVKIVGGVAGNVIPDHAAVSISYRWAPDRTAAEAEAHLRDVFDGFDVTITDAIAGAPPNLNNPAIKSFIDVVSLPPEPKFGWTDVARFTELGIPALNFGPADPSLAHTKDEYVPIAQLRECESLLRDWLTR